MRLLAVILLLTLGARVVIADTQTHAVTTYIMTVNKSLDLNSATRMSAHIIQSCHRYHIPCKPFVLILAQESRFKVSAYNAKSIDYGIGQINYKTVTYYKLDSNRLLNDVEYSIDSSARVLSWFYKTYKHESLWYCRYNVGVADLALKPNIRDLCIKYVNRLTALNY